jgi:hypothetical protein
MLAFTAAAPVGRSRDVHLVRARPLTTHEHARLGYAAKMLRRALAGAAAGAAGTTALNVVTYVDMAVRGRPASTTPQDMVEALADRLGVEVPGDGERRANRSAGLGALMGLATGVGVGAAYGIATSVTGRPPRWLGAGFVGLAAMVGTNVPMTRLGVTDPRTWDAVSWLSDIVPHAAYGIVTALTYEGLDC